MAPSERRTSLAAADGQTLEHAQLLGSGAVAMTGQNGAAGRQFLGETLDILLAPDGSYGVGSAAT